LPIFAHRDVGNILPQLRLKLGADPPLLINASGVEPGIVRFLLERPLKTITIVSIPTVEKCKCDYQKR
jgi:hypothetical protein